MTACALQAVIFSERNTNIMLSLLRHITNIRHYLAYQIFSTFWISLALILAITISIPTFDSRSFHPLNVTEKNFFESESFNTERRYNLDEIFERHLMVKSSGGFDIILFDRHLGLFVGAPADKIKPLQAFIYRADNPDKPQKSHFDNLEILGPFFVQTDKREYYQYFTRRVSPQQNIFNYFFDTPWLVLLILLLVSTPILIWLSWYIAKPVKTLSQTANSVALGNLSVNPKLETEGIAELRKVGKSFNQMIQSLQELINHQQRMLSDISHELKTPLARLQLATALLRRRIGETTETQRIENEIQKLNTMVYDLLDLSRKQLNVHLNREIFPINFIWENILEDAAFETEQNNITLTVNQHIATPDDYLINGNVATLASAMENVIRNAQKYAKSKIDVTLNVEKKHLIITIDDDGKGVPPSEYTQIFRPFYRVEEDRARQSGGTGLGLAIVANAVQQHKGTVRADSSPYNGLRIEMTLPLWEE